ncbi:MAG: 3-oxoadipate CoA-transferase, partial [Sphingomonas sp.]|nr:3-oxoadipate CoA-transferase [Sphingomonas sp.]
MIDKTVATALEAIADLRDGAAIMISGFGDAGAPAELIDAVVAQGASDLT